MPLIAQHTRLARLIDTHVREILAHSGSDEAIHMLMADAMGTLQWLETCTDADMDALCERYEGLYCFATNRATASFTLVGTSADFPPVIHGHPSQAML